MQMKRKPIRKKVQLVVLLIAVVALVISSGVGLGTLLRVKGNSEKALISQMEQELHNVVTAKASLAESELNKFKSYVQQSALFIRELYENPEHYVKREVLPPDAANAGIFAMQRYPIDETYALEGIVEELSLLGNLEQLWAPMIEENKELVTTVYVGAAGGFLISYDPGSDLGVTPGSAESYYDFRGSSWYVQAQKEEAPFFTEMYADSYGRGLMITCASPFRNEKGEFAGAVAMDILVTDLHDKLLEMDMGEGTFAFLVDEDANVIASPFLAKGDVNFRNLKDADHQANEVADKILAYETGITHAPSGAYYAYTPIHSTRWMLCVYIPEQVVMAPVMEMEKDINATMIFFGAMFVVIVVVVSLVVRRFSRSLTTPLLALGKDADTIAGGDLDYRATVRSNDEIGDLANNFNHMAESLQTYIRDLTTMTAEKERIGAELDVATHIQSSMLPCIFPAFPGRPEIDIYATMNPAKEVGGDFYDFFMVDDRHLAIVVADVSGKGVPAALFMVIGKTLIKDHTQPGRDLGDVFTEVNNLLCESNSEGLFITAFEGVLDLVTGEFRYVNAGHETPFIAKKNEPFKPFKVRPGFVLAGMEGIRYKAGVMQLEPGDKVFQYSDGVPEATNAANELYGMERLEKVLADAADKMPHEILPAVKADIDAFVDAAPQFDDITMLCLEYKERMKEDGCRADGEPMPG